MTPILKLKTTKKSADIWIKLENISNSGSSKERICSAIISDAENRGKLHPGKTTVVEATSGNTGIALSLVCVEKGYRTTLFMPENTAAEKKSLARLFGAEIVETPSDESLRGAIRRAGKFAAEMPDERFFANQFSNPLNPATHRTQTAREIIAQAKQKDTGAIDAFIMGVGTGGTITGVGLEIKNVFPNAEVVAVEPESSAVLSGGKPGKHSISGIGTGFIPDILDTGAYNRVVTVTDGEALKGVSELALNNGIFAGISSGANYVAALKMAEELGPEKQVFTIACDSGNRYISMK